MTLNRSAFVELSDAQLLAQCAVDTYRASGPGGQKRNKTSSAVRLRHEPTGLMVIAEESRSQHENKAKALRRLPRPPPPQALGLLALKGGRRGERFWPTGAQVLDIWWAVEGQLATAAQQIGVSSGQLLAFLQREPTLWTQANLARREFGHKPLRAT
ncbi:MAG TPA: peptide chain release factor-like protein [Gemmatales bacterium]|nr:peptide chain release factor-like protein [Gemmatales bacterium]